MTAVPSRTRCDVCDKETAILQCKGCSKDFCFNDFENHRQELNQKLDKVETNCDQYQKILTEHTAHQQNNLLLEQINKWEEDSIKIIRQAAEEARQFLLTHTHENIVQFKTQLNKLTDQLQRSRQENNFFESDLNRWNEKLERLTDELNHMSNIELRQDSTPLISNICVDISSRIYGDTDDDVSPLHHTTAQKMQRNMPKIDDNGRWMQNGITIVGGNGKGDELNQLNCPCGLYIDDDHTIYIVDSENHRVMEWKSDATSGTVVAGGNSSGNRPDQLNQPTDVILDKETDSLIICDKANRRVMRWPRRNGIIGETVISDIDCFGISMDSDGILYISDCEKNEVRRWRIGETSGTLVAGGNGNGDNLNQLYFPSYIFVDWNQSVYVSDSKNQRVMKWVKGGNEGVVVAAGQGQGPSLTRLSGPQGVIADQSGNVYVADFSNDRIVCWSEGARQGSIVVGGNGAGEQANQLSGPNGIVFDRQGHLYVVEQNNHRVQRFQYTASI